MSALLEAPDTEAEGDGAAVDRKLVAAVRHGDDRAFETLYERYHRRIHAYVLGMVKDHQRAEDVTQDVFMSAVRRMRATERPIAFKPWIYEIAKNACIDQFRRSKRAEEVSFDADDGLAPSDYGRLVSPEPVPDAALLAKLKLDDLCGAFGGLSDAHHEILVLRELEGLSYREIGERMGMSRPAVESTLFRARRRLTEEYDELASGERCLRIQGIIARVGSAGRLGARDTRRLARHAAHCQPCRRHAVAAGVDNALLAHRPMRDRVAAKIAGLLPFPLFRRGGDGGSSWLHQLPLMGDQAAGGAKLAAAAALVIAGLGVGSQVAPSHDQKSPSPAAVVRSERTSEPTRTSIQHPATLLRDTGARSAAAGGTKTKTDKRASAHRSGGSVRHAKAGSGSGSGSGAGNAPSAGGSKPSSGNSDASTPGGGGGSKQQQQTSSGRPKTPTVKVPAAGGGTGDAVQQTSDAVQQTTDAVQQTTDQVTDTVDDVTSGATAPVTGAVDDTVQGATDTVDETVQGATDTVGGAVEDPAGTVGGAVEDPVGTVGDVVGGATGGVLP